MVAFIRNAIGIIEAATLAVTSNGQGSSSMPNEIQRHLLHLPNGTRHKLKSPNRQDTRAYHTYSKAWRQLRTAILVRDGYTCELCGLMDASNHVDHKDGDSWNNEHGNLRVLCKSCHSAHGKQGDGMTRERGYGVA